MLLKEVRYGVQYSPRAGTGKQVVAVMSNAMKVPAYAKPPTS